MGDRIMWSRQEEVERVWVHEGLEFSHRLITRRHQGCSFSFHVTTYVPFFDTIVEGDGVHATACKAGRGRPTCPTAANATSRPAMPCICRSATATAT